MPFGSPHIIEVVVDGPQGLPGPEGPAGPQGGPGSQGVPGEPGVDGAGSYYQTFNFASPSDLWTIEHNTGSMALSVDLYDTSGDPIEATVVFVDLNTIAVEWYYPMAGEARVFR